MHAPNNGYVIIASFGLLARATYHSVSAYLAISNHIPEEISGHEEAFRFTPLRNDLKGNPMNAAPSPVDRVHRCAVGRAGALEEPPSNERRDLFRNDL
ncbi:hypothetical protein ALC53_07104 [Atta colombica]|uniref:Uncharacterized protein n=1 Tax=Atta colombica TaxID=520822 RepID=A0A195BDH8_9HYME|nr:hypothetical protein ALC53_07104 [Atta colombica]